VQPYGYTNQTVQPPGFSNVAPANYSQIQPYAGVNNGGYGTNPADAQPALTPGEYSESNITNYPSYPNSYSDPTPYSPPADDSSPTPAEQPIETRSVIKQPDGIQSQDDPQNQIQLNSPGGQGDAQSGDGKQTATRRRAVTPYVDPNSQWNREPQPAPQGKTANSPLRRNWNYSPRLASYQPSRISAPGYQPQNSAQPVRNDRIYQRQPQALNEGWKSGN
jgi:hypothetical protein